VAIDFELLGHLRPVVGERDFLDADYRQQNIVFNAGHLRSLEESGRATNKERPDATHAGRPSISRVDDGVDLRQGGRQAVAAQKVDGKAW
jgi:hypothetical protein